MLDISNYELIRFIVECHISKDLKIITIISFHVIYTISRKFIRTEFCINTLDKKRSNIMRSAISGIIKSKCLEISVIA